jgi:hypothetical protein
MRRQYGTDHEIDVEAEDSMHGELALTELNAPYDNPDTVAVIGLMSGVFNVETEEMPTLSLF